jgi:drug/metabolite transporter (DMT)-like permease
VPIGVVVLVLAAALVHSVWNLLLARAHDSEAATAVALVCGAVLVIPVSVATWQVEAAAVPWLVTSAAVEVAYFALLSLAYQRFELSVVYPIARGSAPVLVLVTSTLLLGAHLGLWEAVGVLVVGGGVLLVRGLHRPSQSADVVFALAIAACIASYTLLDQQGLRHAAALPYNHLVLTLTAIAFGWLQVQRKGADALRAQLSWRTAVAGVGIFAAYGLTLVALRRAEAAPVAAVRETSIVFATALAAVVLREHVSRSRWLGAAVVVTGVALIAFA